MKQEDEIDNLRKENERLRSEKIVQYIFSKNDLRDALKEVLTEFDLIKKPDIELRPPATRTEACKFLNISTPTLVALINSGQLKSFNIGRSVRIRWSDLEDFVKNKD